MMLFVRLKRKKLRLWSKKWQTKTALKTGNRVRSEWHFRFGGNDLRRRSISDRRRLLNTRARHGFFDDALRDLTLIRDARLG